MISYALAAQLLSWYADDRRSVDDRRWPNGRSESLRWPPRLGHTALRHHTARPGRCVTHSGTFACRRKKDHGRAEALLLAAWSALYLPEHAAKIAAAHAERAAAQPPPRRKRRATPLGAAQHARLLELHADAAVATEAGGEGGGGKEAETVAAGR
jgi:hypothetical protein